MRFAYLGSGSKGNALIVEAGGELMSIEAGHASLEEVYTRYFEGVRDAA